MITTLLRVLFLLAGAPSDEHAHEAAHVACELGVYAAVAPQATDDAAVPLAELVAGPLCRWEMPGERWSL